MEDLGLVLLGFGVTLTIYHVSRYIFRKSQGTFYPTPATTVLLYSVPVKDLSAEEEEEYRSIKKKKSKMEEKEKEKEKEKEE